MILQLSPQGWTPQGLPEAVAGVAAELAQDWQLTVQIQDDGQPKPLAPTVGTALLRTLRELLVNVARHARVRQAELSAERTPDGLLCVTLRDAGSGFDAGEQPAGFGLRSARERLAGVGGTLTVESVPGVGTTAVLRLPLLEPPPGEPSGGNLGANGGWP